MTVEEEAKLERIFQRGVREIRTDEFGEQITFYLGTVFDAEWVRIGISSEQLVIEHHSLAKGSENLTSSFLENPST